MIADVTRIAINGNNEVADFPVFVLLHRFSKKWALHYFSLEFSAEFWRKQVFVCP